MRINTSGLVYFMDFMLLLYHCIKHVCMYVVCARERRDGERNRGKERNRKEKKRETYTQREIERERDRERNRNRERQTDRMRGGSQYILSYFPPSLESPVALSKMALHGDEIRSSRSS